MNLVFYMEEIMEISLKYAISKAKRNIENDKYDRLSNILEWVSCGGHFITR